MAEQEKEKDPSSSEPPAPDGPKEPAKEAGKGGSATATAIVSAWTSRPINRTLLMTGSFRMWLCVQECSDSQRNPRCCEIEPVVPL